MKSEILDPCPSQGCLKRSLHVLDRLALFLSFIVPQYPITIFVFFVALEINFYKFNSVFILPVCINDPDPESTPRPLRDRQANFLAL